jgi:hypothetical protein
VRENWATRVMREIRVMGVTRGGRVMSSDESEEKYSKN